MARIVSPMSAFCFGYSSWMSRPTIMWMIRDLAVPAAGMVPTFFPFRRTVILSASEMISSSLWEM